MDGVFETCHLAGYEKTKGLFKTLPVDGLC
jgi:hypothetical protein